MIMTNGCAVTNRREWVRVVLSRDISHVPKCKAKQKPENANKCIDSFQRNFTEPSAFLYCNKNPGKSTNDVACSLHAALLSPETSSIISKTAPALETANNATPMINQACRGIAAESLISVISSDFVAAHGLYPLNLATGFQIESFFCGQN